MRIWGIKPSFINDPKPNKVLWNIVMNAIPKNTTTSWSQKRRCNKPIKLQFLSIFNTDNFDAPFRLQVLFFSIRTVIHKVSKTFLQKTKSN